MKPSPSSFKKGLALLGLFFGLLGPCHAETVLGNLAKFTNNQGTPSAIGVMGKALSFSMSKSYVLETVTLRLYRPSPDLFTPVVELWSADQTGKPLAWIEFLSPPELAHNTRAMDYVFKAKARVVLKAEKQYCLVVKTTATEPDDVRDFFWQNGNPPVSPAGSGATFLSATWGPSYDEPYSWTKTSTMVNWFEIEGKPL